MSLYESFDEQIVASIRDAGLSQFWEILAPLREDADAIARPGRRGERDGWRVLDRRLQALRRAGRLAYDRKAGWRASDGER